ncbi:MAG: hypothetical protein ACREHE_13215 [Rhizomicrobium sp.]
MDGEKPRTQWALWVGIGVAIVAAFARLPHLLQVSAPHLHAGEVFSVAGYAAGEAGFVALILVAIIYFAVLSGRAPERTARYFGVIFAVFLVTSLGLVFGVKSFADRDDAQMRIAAGEMTRAFNTVMDPNGGHIDMRIKSTGDAGEMERLVKSELADLYGARTEYRARMQALGVRTLMTPEELSRDRGMTHTRANLAAAREAVKKFRTDYTLLVTGFRKRVQDSHVRSDIKAGMLNGIDTALARSQSHSAAILDCEDSIFAEFEKMAALLAHPHGRWEARGDKMLFASNADLVAYQDHLTAVRAYQQRERQIADDARNEVLQDEARMPGQ